MSCKSVYTYAVHAYDVSLDEICFVLIFGVFVHGIVFLVLRLPEAWWCFLA